MNASRKPSKKIVLLYNDRDRSLVLQLRKQLMVPFATRDLYPWMASEDMSPFLDIFQNIEGAIRDALGSIMFLGGHGLGRFQENIEQGAVSTEIWLRGAQYGRLVVHLSGGLEVPPSLLRWTSVNHDGTVQGATALAQAIARRFGCEDGEAT